MTKIKKMTKTTNDCKLILHIFVNYVMFGNTTLCHK